MKTRSALLFVSALLAGTASACAGTHGVAPMTSDIKKDTAMKTSDDLADGEIRRVDTENKRITIKHGVIKNLDMPGMTMVFQVKDVTLLSKVKEGDKVRFSVEKSGSAFVVTAIEVSK